MGGPAPTIWQAFETLLAESLLVIDRPAGSAHPRYPARVYPLDYGYLEETRSMDGQGIDVWRGGASDAGLVALAITVDLVKRDSEVKLLIDCSEQDIAAIARFLNDSSVFSAKILRRVETGR